jgi:hypothetical protein
MFADMEALADVHGLCTIPVVLGKLRSNKACSIQLSYLPPVVPELSRSDTVAWGLNSVFMLSSRIDPLFLALVRLGFVDRVLVDVVLGRGGLFDTSGLIEYSLERPGLQEQKGTGFGLAAINLPLEESLNQGMQVSPSLLHNFFEQCAERSGRGFELCTRFDELLLVALHFFRHGLTDALALGLLRVDFFAQAVHLAEIVIVGFAQLFGGGHFLVYTGGNDRFPLDTIVEHITLKLEVGFFNLAGRALVH